MAEMTPLMRQYWDIKSLHQDKVLLFRMGDFFEMFFDDAVKAAPLLGIALTSRNKKAQDETPMCGVPHHSVAGPINKLLASGLKVAICDQIEDPKQAKGIVKRAVTRVLTPGMVYDPETLETSHSIYMACLEDGDLACVETSTGESFCFTGLKPEELQSLLDVLRIVEVVKVPEHELNHRFSEQIVVSNWAELAPTTHDHLKSAPSVKAARRLLSYISSLQGSEGRLVLKPFELRSLAGRMHLSPSVVRQLEIFQTYKGDLQGSFFWSINRTQTSFGSRLLRQWIQFPLLDLKQIEARLNSIEGWQKDLTRLQRVRNILRGMGDLERRLAKVGQPSSHARDLLALKDCLRAGLLALSEAGQNFDHKDTCESLASEIEATFVEDPPLSVRQGHMVKAGYNAALDELILLTTDSQSLLEKMEAREKELTGISSLKIRYNQVFGYYIEVTNTHADKVPTRYSRKQTLANAERFCTEELIELEKKVLSAQARRSDLEYEIFAQKKNLALSKISEILSLASLCAELDVMTSLAWVALERKYSRPRFSDQRGLRLMASRHPVVEQTMARFVPNDVNLDAGHCMLLTGPNMAGKSTLMRQVALTVLMAQMGSFVPADEAELAIFDQVFTRIGASDQLTEGLSTFMVEMTETAEILKQMTSKSLVIFDEIGRGTSTFDGMSLAQSILEFLLKRKKALSFFATHYHELTELEKSFSSIQNAHMTVSEQNGEVRFLHTLVKGPALKSYGIHVAQIAGLPKEVTIRASEILKKKENFERKPQMSLFESAWNEPETGPDVNVVENPYQPVLDGIRDWPVQKKTPLDALNQIAQWQNLISSQSSNSNH